MEIDKIIDDNFIDKISTYESILIIGFTKTGKVKLAEKLGNILNINVIKTDEYLKKYNNDLGKSLDHLYKDAMELESKELQYIIEGTLGFRLLRKGVEEGTYNPDFIIRTVCSEDNIVKYYKEDGESHKIKKAMTLNKGLTKIWKDYLHEFAARPFEKIPDYMEVDTNV